MHACLSVDEILRLIACELVGSRAKATAVALACSCKSFEVPALDALWRTQEQLPLLLKSLPGEVWNGYKYTVSMPTTCVSFFLNYLDRKSFKRLPTTPEWARFRKYARRMRVLSVSGDLDFSLSPEVFGVLQFCAISKPLFPNLERLSLWHIVGGFIPFIPLFLSSGITVVRITFSEYRGLPNTALVASMFTTFPTLCPNLQDISLYSVPRDPVIVTAVSEFLLATNRDTFRYLRVDSLLTEEACEVLYKLPNLCELSVVVKGSTSLPTMVLPNLTNMDVEYDHDRDWYLPLPLSTRYTS